MSFWERFKLAASNIWRYLLPLFRVLVRIGGEVAVSVAISAVKRAEAEYGSGNGDLKRAFATEAILEDMKVRGFEIGVREAHDLIQTALRYIDER